MINSAFTNVNAPAVVRYADARSREGREKSIRIMLAKSHDGHFTLHRLQYGVGRRTADVENRLGNPFSREHLAIDAFESELVNLELAGFDIVDDVTRDVPSTRVDMLALNNYSSVAYGHMSFDQRRALKGRHALRVHSGIHAVVVADEFMNIHVYPANKVGVTGCELPVRKLTQLYLQSACYSEQPTPSVVEGFYSETAGFVITDAAMVHGRQVDNLLFSERHAAMIKAFGLQESLFTDGVAPLLVGSSATIGETSASVVNSPVFIVKTERSTPTVHYQDTPVCGLSLVIDDEPAVLASVQVIKGEMRIYSMASGGTTKLRTSSSLDFYDCVNVAAYLRAGEREPLLFF